VQQPQIFSLVQQKLVWLDQWNNQQLLPQYFLILYHLVLIIIPFSSDVDLVFLADGAATAPTRRNVLYEYTKSTSIFNWKGFATLTFPSATNHTIRGFRVSRNLYTTGTVGVVGTAVTGSGSVWTTDRMSVGSRIGFGSSSTTISSSSSSSLS